MSSSTTTFGNTALCTVLDDNFLPGFAVMAKSLLRTHPGLNLPLYIIYHPKHAPLSEASKRMAERWYPNLHFHEVDPARYKTVWSNRDGKLQTPHRLKSAFFILEAFNFNEYDRVVTLDCDMVITGDLSQLFQSTAAFAATQAIDYDLGKILNYFNSGVMVIGKVHLSGVTYEAILNHTVSPEYDRRKGKADQAILNDFFGANYTELDEAYNVTKRKYPDTSFGSIDELFTEQMRILHFVAEKPWEMHVTESSQRYTKLENFWLEQFQEAVDFESLFKHFRQIHSTSQQRSKDLDLQHKEVIKFKKGMHIAEQEVRNCRIHAEQSDRVVDEILTRIESLAAPSTKAKGMKQLTSYFLAFLSRKRILSRTAKCRKIWAKYSSEVNISSKTNKDNLKP
jgi:lipopolysaccharide biosynthesis glycosyltransferase